MSTRSRRRALLSFSAAVVLVVAACSSTSTPALTQAPAATTAPESAAATEGASAPTSNVDEIRIGLLFPTTGAFASLGTEQKNGAKMILDQANANGGVNGVPIKIFEADSKSDPAVGATEAQRLIDQNQVQIIIGSYSSGISAATSPVAERNNVIYWEVGAVANDISQQGYKNFLRTVGTAETYGAADIDFVKNYIAPQMGVDPSEVRIAVANENGAFGSSVADGILAAADAEGMNVVIHEAYDAKSTDLTPLVLRLKDATPDVLLIVPLPADSQLFWEQAKAQDFNVKAVVGSAGFSSPSFVEKFGAAGVEGAMDVEAPSVNAMNTAGLSPEIASQLQQLLTDYQSQYGHECLVHCGDGMGGAQILVADVLPGAIAAGSLDAATIRQAAAQVDIPEGGSLQGFGVKFDDNGDNERAKSYIMQWHDGALQVVYPSTLAVSDPQFPMPTWSER